MKQKRNTHHKKSERTPIIDGDTRPDQPVEVKETSGSKPVAEEKKVTSNRGADVNSLEDFRDEKS